MTSKQKLTLFYFLAIIPFVPISLVSHYFRSWPDICIGGRILVLLYGIYSTVVRKKFSVPLALAVLYFLGYFISTFLAHISYTPLSDGGVYLFGMTLLIEDGVARDVDAMIDGMLLWFEILVYANLLFYILYSAGCFDGSGYKWDSLLGNHGWIVRRVFPGLILGGIKAFRTKNRITLRFACMCLALTFYLLRVRAMTASIGMIIFITAILWYEFTKKSGIFKYEYFVILSGLISIQFTVLRRFSFAEGFITKVLGKNMTLTGRTRIWVKTISKIYEKPLLGFGQLTSTGTTKLIGKTDPHNILLGTLFYGGILSLIILVVILTVYGRKIYSDRKQNRKFVFIFDAGFCACFIMWCFIVYAHISEFPGLYILFVMAYYCKEFEKDMTSL